MTLRTKILPAPVAPTTLARAQLQARLDQALRRRVTTVIAGAGVGKSTLLAAWAQRHDVAWYTLEPQDAALSTLARGLVDALRLRVPDLPVDLAATSEAARGPDASADEGARADAFSAALSEALQERLRRPLALVLDDLRLWRPTAPPCVRSRRCAVRRPRPCTSSSPRAPSCASRSTACAGRASSSSSGAPTSPSPPTKWAPCSRPSSALTRGSSARRSTR